MRAEGARKEEAVMKLLGEHTDNFKTAAEAALVKRQNQKTRKWKRETDQKDPTFTGYEAHSTLLFREK